MAKKKVTIAREECTACETCWVVCPEFFEQNPGDTFSQVVTKYRVGGSNAEGDAPENLLDKIQEAADSCPVQIIQIA